MGFNNTKYVNAETSTKRKMERVLINGCKSKNYKDIKLMLKLGVPSNIADVRNPKAMTALMCVPYSFMAGMTSKMLKRRRSRKDTAFNIVNLLLKYKADVKLTDAYGKTALHHFAAGCDPDALQLLLETGCDVNVQDPYTGNSPLHYTCLSLEAVSGKLCLVKLLLSYGADPNIQNNTGETPLHLCTRANMNEAAAILLHNAADVNLVNHKDETVLHYCQSQIIPPESLWYGTIKHWNTELAEMFIQGGVDVNIENRSGKTVLYLVFSSLRPTEMKCFCTFKPSTFGCRNNSKTAVKMCQILMKYNHFNKNKRTFLQSSALWVYYNYSFYCTGEAGDECLFLLGVNPNSVVHRNVPLEELLLSFPISVIRHIRKYIRNSVKLNIQAGLSVNSMNSLKYSSLENLIRIQDEELLEMVRLTGFKLFHNIDKDDIIKLSGNDQLLGSVQAENHLLTLKQMTSNLIRTSLQPNAIVGIQFVDLPKQLKSFVVLDYDYPDINFNINED